MHIKEKEGATPNTGLRSIITSKTITDDGIALAR
jgi:hypothetical protein